MMYLDTNIVLYTITKDAKYEKACAKILRDIHEGKIKACASLFVLIEIMNGIRKMNNALKQRNEALFAVQENIDAVLSLPITWFEVSVPVIQRAAQIEYPISPADYLHAATMEVNGITTIVTTDAEFDKVAGIKRIDPLQYKHE